MTRTLPFLVVALAAAAASAETAVVVTLQGRLLGAGDAPVSGETSLRFAIYAVESEPTGTQPAPLWSATYSKPLVDGLYAVNLGDKTDASATALPASVFHASEPRWLGLSVAGSSELKPRLRIGTAPLAVTALTAVTAQDSERLGGLSLSDLDGRFAPKTGGSYVDLQGTSGSAQAGSVRVTGSVEAGSFAGNGADLTALSASALASGTLPPARLAGTYGEALELTNAANKVTGTFTGSGAALTSLDASSLTAGTVASARVKGSYGEALELSNPANKVTGTFAGNGAALTDLSSAALTGAIPSNVLPSGLARTGVAQTFTAAQTFGDVTITGSLTTAGLRAGADSRPCTDAIAGSLRYSGGVLAACDGGEWVTVLEGARNQKATARVSCEALRAAGEASTNGVYWIDPDAGDSANAVRVWCDVTTWPGEGWTVLAHAPSHETGSRFKTTADSGRPGDFTNGWNQYLALKAFSTAWFGRFRGYYRYREDQPGIAQFGNFYEPYIDYIAQGGNKNLQQLANNSFTTNWSVRTSEGATCTTWHSLFTPFWDSLAITRSGGSASHNYCGYYHSPEGWCSQAYPVNSCNRGGYAPYLWAWYMVR